MPLVFVTHTVMDVSTYTRVLRAVAQRLLPYTALSAVAADMNGNADKLSTLDGSSAVHCIQKSEKWSPKSEEPYTWLFWSVHGLRFVVDAVMLGDVHSAYGAHLRPLHSTITQAASTALLSVLPKRHMSALQASMAPIVPQVKRTLESVGESVE